MNIKNAFVIPFVLGIFMSANAFGEVQLPNWPPGRAPVDFMLPAEGRITGQYGDYRGEEFHYGLDIANNVGKHIYASADGDVSFVGNQVDNTGKVIGYGYNIKIVHHISETQTYMTIYAHLSDGSALVKSGDQVVRGQKIATMGSTGHSTGPHLHFEVRNSVNIGTANLAIVWILCRGLSILARLSLKSVWQK